MKLKETLKLAWENKGKIAEGFYNTYISLDKEMEQEAQRRMAICESNQCGYYDKEGKPETSVIPGEPACSLCHCNIKMLVHTMSSDCAIKKMDIGEGYWDAITTNEQEMEVGQQKWEKQFQNRK